MVVPSGKGKDQLYQKLAWVSWVNNAKEGNRLVKENQGASDNFSNLTHFLETKGYLGLLSWTKDQGHLN